MKEVVIVSAVRTPIGKIGGTLKNIEADKLLMHTINGAIEKIKLDKSLIDEVIIGQAKQSTDYPNIARLSLLMAGIPESTPGYTVHRQCASGMQAILNGMHQIQLGYSDIVLAGGVESMSSAPFYLRNVRYGVGNGNKVLVDPNIESQPKSQPNDIYGTFNMIDTADIVAKEYKISRKKQDEFALQSQLRAIEAIDTGKFKDEIIPIKIKANKKEEIIFDEDEYPRRNTSIEKLNKLRTISEDGTVTAGNASGRNDGASVLVLMSREKAKELNLKPLVRIMGSEAAGVDPRIMG
ncbi:MAG: thiolase family protein, partial [Bacillota bacterium]|nr:thiolase family protein [Bacillota bacterium]